MVQLDNPCGLMIQANNISKAELLRHVQAANYRTCTVLDDWPLAIDLKIPYSVFRSYNFEPSPGNNPEAAAKAALKEILSWDKPRGWEKVYVLVNNEQSFSKQRLDMYAHMMRLSSKLSQPIGFIFGNFAAGAVSAGQGQGNNSVLPVEGEKRERNDWYINGEHFLRTAHELRHVKTAGGTPAFILGDHCYTGLHPWIACNGGEKAKEPYFANRPDKIDWTKPQWHLGRTDQALMQCYNKWNIPLNEGIPQIKTECLIDDMDDVAYTFGDRSRGLTGLRLHRGFPMWEQFTKARGFRSLEPQYREWYPGQELYSLYADMMIWAWETIYAPLGWVIGTHTYTYGDNSGNRNLWWSFRVD